jgi:hypothetical protein
LDESGVSVTELSLIYSCLSDDQRDELLQCLLIAASADPDAMMQVVRGEVPVIAAEEMNRRLQVGPP